LKTQIFAAAVVAMLTVTPARAGNIMPDFADVPTGWVVDRFDPETFRNAGTVNGRNNVLEIGISNDDSLANRPAGFQSTFYNTQGRQHAVSGGIGDYLAADLYIPTDWLDPTNGSRRTDMWGVMTNGTGVSAYTIIGFTNYGGAARFRVWDPEAVGTTDGWVNLATAVDTDDWNALRVDFTGTTFEYSIGGALVYTDITTFGTTGYSATIMQAYNFGDPALVGAFPDEYEALWSNAIPEPGTLALFAGGLAGLAVARRRRAVAKA
jgi:hypothetical protein